MDSEAEDCSSSNVSSSDLELRVDMNGDQHTNHKNGDHQVTISEDALLPDIQMTGDNDNSKSSENSCEDSIVVLDNTSKGIKSSNNSKDEATISRELISEALELRPVNSGPKTEARKEQKSEANGETNGKETTAKDGNPPAQRRMSLRPRAAPKKYADNEQSSGDEQKSDPPVAKDPLEIPLGKNSSTVLIRRSPTAAIAMLRSPPVNKSPIKPMTKVIRPPPELIKAPINNKISISPATSVTVIPRSKENSATPSNKSGFVVVDTQSILKGKSSVPVNSVQASVTVSAVPSPLRAAALTSKSVTAPASSNTARKNTPSINANAAAATAISTQPDPFESLGLADDSFIVEAPSFVVPYLIEKTAPENLKKTVESLCPPKKKEVVAELSEDDSSDSENKERDSPAEKAETVATTPSSVNDKATKGEAEKPVVKSETNKEEEDYFSGPIGRFFLDIGLSLVQEYVQGDLLRSQKRKVHKGTKIADPSLSVNALSKGLDITRAKNDPLRLPWRSCDRCNFKSESKLVLAHHWSLPLSMGFGPTARFGCHWCPFEAKEPHLVSSHIDSEHGMKMRTGPELSLHQCPLCPFEDQTKSKVTRHVISCQKRFVAERNLEPPLDWEPPAKIPRMPSRGLRGFSGGINAAGGLHGYSLAAATAKGLSLPYHPLMPKSALLNNMGYGVLPTGGGKPNKGANQSQGTLAGLRLPAELHVVQGAAQRGTTAPGSGATKAAYRQQATNASSLYLNAASYAVPSNQIYQAIAKSFQLLHGQGSTMSVLPSAGSKNQTTGTSAIDKLKKTSNSNSISLVSGLVNTSGLTIQSSTAPSVNKTKTNQQPSISITPLPRSTASTLANKPSLSVSPVTPASTNSTSSISNNALTPKAGQPATPGQKGAVVCEICDGSIKDLEQLRHHMQWIHKVKIHPKMIHNRPPLNCQKCQCRFFTDQGLERHLLGSHGLVTSSMQEAANRGQDGGRCPICGKVHQWKLLSHVVKDHGLSLKPAHLSYKCTVCTATFTMYKLFENHVYTAHSVVARKVLDKDKVDVRKSSGSTNATSNSSSTGTLRINDEITIIPQSTRHDSSDQNTCRPARTGEKRSRVDIIDLSDDEDKKESRTLPKSQVTITKVPAPKGSYLSKNSLRESASKRSRVDGNDTE